MHTLSCPHCPKTFTKPTLDRARQALQMHIGRAHTKVIPTATREIMARNIAKANAAKAKQREAEAQLHGQAIAQQEEQQRIEAKPKRTYTKRPKVEPITGEVKINFCPNCGFDIRKAALGIVIGQNHAV